MFSKNLKYLREKNGLDQMQFAEKLGRKSPSTVSEWEKGKYTPKLGVLSDIAHIFNVSIEEMMHVNLAEKDAKGEINIIPTFNELNRSNQIKTFEFAKNKLTEQNDKHILSSRSTAAGAPDYEDAQQKIIVRNEVPRGADEVVTI
ncbi:helix-turn-helix transcriptional regulator, partial [Liquorilactobacillus mali]